MSRATVKQLSKDELRSLDKNQLEAHIKNLRVRLSAYPSGPVHKSLIKQIEIAEKLL